MSQLIGMHEAYRIARNSGYIKDQAVSYATIGCGCQSHEGLGC